MKESLKEGLLVVKVNGEFLGLRTKYVKAIVEVTEENFKKTSLLSKYTVGAVVYHNNFYPLVCLESVLKNTPVEECLKEEAIAVIIQKNDKACALLVDEIVTIEVAERVNIESGESEIFKIKNGFVTEFDFSLLEHLNIPFLVFKESYNKSKETTTNRTYYLIVEVGNKKLAIDARLIRKVVSVDSSQSISLSKKSWINEAFSIDGKVIKSSNLKKLLDLNNSMEGQYLVLLEKDRKQFALLVDNIEDILTIPEGMTSKSVGEHKLISGFLNLEDNIIPLISSSFLVDTLNEEATIISKEEKHKKLNSNEGSYLVFLIGNHKLGVELKKVKKLIRSENAKVVTYGASSGGVIRVGKEIYPMIILRELFREKNFDISKLDFLLLEEEGKFIAVPISEVIDIVKASSSQTIKSKDLKDLFSKAILDEEGNVINVLNISKLLEGIYA